MSSDRRSSLDYRSQNLGEFQIDSVEQPAPGQPDSGDFLFFELTMDNELLFLIGDMAGSGRTGHAAWSQIENDLRSAWSHIVASRWETQDLRHLGEAINRSAFAANTSLCLAAGRFHADRVDWAVWGYGVHVLPSAKAEVRTLLPPADYLGLKLGWLPDTEFRGTAGSFVSQSMLNPTRMIIFTDGLLGEDHAAPDETWSWIENIARDSDMVEVDRLLRWVIGKSDIRTDDITAAVIFIPTRA